ncbi:class I ribonucleotide reductase maintenance protein YfaE [Alteromonas sp. ASW11-130]|uniref:class I ribonucleotide reductase maintenance protein YfaE n=1 Tax=Alteromonas sp. ASW11-130 TaxID=3015775 RepID=UPI002241913F|nr:class I ribonucleotide reductase maintenance protein YfaE [Alteromonas sp. ASW11-130]MCW8092411.1 class I ribonucleotide reductase maintenance protein YfaE [Alteromonas sp. ASW11-130]
MTHLKDEAFHIDVIDVGCAQSSSDKTLLESLEEADIDIHFHCREGFCGACRTQLLDGKVDYTTDPLAYIDDDEILPCCCIATSNLTIKVPL